MNKLKKELAAMREHLHRDRYGLGLLDAITKTANDTRKNLALTKEVQQAATERSQGLKQEMEGRDAEIRELKSELNRVTNRLNTSERKLQELNARVADLEAELEAGMPEDLPVPERDTPAKRTLGEVDYHYRLAEDPDGFTAMFNSLRRDMRICPAPAHPARFREILEDYDRNERIAVYEISDVIQDYSGASMIRLGRFVTAGAMMNMPTAVASISPFPKHKKEGLKYNPSIMSKFVYWFRNNFDFGKVQFAEGKELKAHPANFGESPRLLK